MSSIETVNTYDLARYGSRDRAFFFFCWFQTIAYMGSHLCLISSEAVEHVQNVGYGL